MAHFYRQVMKKSPIRYACSCKQRSMLIFSRSRDLVTTLHSTFQFFNPITDKVLFPILERMPKDTFKRFPRIRRQSTKQTRDELAIVYLRYKILVRFILYIYVCMCVCVCVCVCMCVCVCEWACVCDAQHFWQKPLGHHKLSSVKMRWPKCRCLYPPVRPSGHFLFG